MSGVSQESIARAFRATTKNPDNCCTCGDSDNLTVLQFSPGGKPYFFCPLHIDLGYKMGGQFEQRREVGKIGVWVVGTLGVWACIMARQKRRRS